MRLFFSRFPSLTLTSRKVRPAVVIGHSSHAGDLFVVPISSQFPNVDLVLQDWRAAGLNVRCGIKSQIATIEDRLVIHSVGMLSAADSASLEAKLRPGCSFDQTRFRRYDELLSEPRSVLNLKTSPSHGRGKLLRTRS